MRFFKYSTWFVKNQAWNEKMCFFVENALSLEVGKRLPATAGPWAIQN